MSAKAVIRTNKPAPVASVSVLTITDNAVLSTIDASNLTTL